MSAVQPTLCIGDNSKPLPVDYNIECLTTAAGAGAVTIGKVTERVEGQILGCRKAKKPAAGLEYLYQVRPANIQALRGNIFKRRQH